MKYEGTRPSGIDKDIPVYTFTVGQEELRLLAQITSHYYTNIPKTFETSPVVNRIRNMRKEIEMVLRKYKIKLK